MLTFLRRGLLGLTLLLAACSTPTPPAVTQEEPRHPARQPALPLALAPAVGPTHSSANPVAIGLIQVKDVQESSGLVRSRLYPHLFWTHNDSGQGPRLYAITATGQPAADPAGILVHGAKARDWEDIAYLGHGRLLIADTGNNRNYRRDLTLYLVAEPHPTATETHVLARYPVHFPDQHDFPPEHKNFDCEAVFVADHTIFLLTKHRADQNTKLYRLNHPRPDQPNQLELLTEFAIGGQVTAADITPDGNHLAVLTYHAVHLFERHRPGPSWFDGTAQGFPIQARQAEAIAWVDEKTLFLTNEQRDIFRLDLPADDLARHP